MADASFPGNCIKGIPNDSFLIDSRTVAPHLFHFKEEHARQDGWLEQSVNWEDDDLAVEFTLDQTKESGERQFKGGVAVLSRCEIDRLNRRPAVNGILSYDRQPSRDNPYHGNILLRANVPKPTRKMVAAGLALAVSEVTLQTKV